MNLETKSKSATEGISEIGKTYFNKKMDRWNAIFNSLSISNKRTSLAVFGILMACLCASLIIQAIQNDSAHLFQIDSITVPNDIHMKPVTETLTPIGKMKGEIDGKFEAFYLAMDKQGQLYKNHNPPYAKDSLNKSAEWELITREQLKHFEEQLHFIPTRTNGLKR
jgi:hypothetical protein